MFRMRCVLSTIILLLLQTWRIQCTCIEVTAMSGNILDSKEFWYAQNTYRKCWEILVPLNKFIHLKFGHFTSKTANCHHAFLEIYVNRTGENYKYCASDNRNPVTALSDAKVTFYLGEEYENKGSFYLHYDIKDIECIKVDSFQCTNHTCIPKNQVCNGVKDCENGSDEDRCETGVATVEGVVEARNQAIDWLKSIRTRDWGWQENTARAATALFLAAGANFNGSILEEELMAKQTELKALVALLRNAIPNVELSMHINALLITCHSPRRFHGNDLVKQLKDQLWSSHNYTHPSAYLALCNANETWPDRAYEDLSDILDSDSEYPFARDMKAFAVMALSCMTDRTQFLHKEENSSLASHYQRSIKQFKKYQTSEGSFGNVHTTALITQALISSGQEHARDWNLNATIKYLIRKLNSTNIDFVTIYLILPVLNSKSLSDIYKVNCTRNPGNHNDGTRDLVTELTDYLGPKMRVQYSLFVGDEKDVIHTISLRVPENFTAFEVMQLAELEYSKYKFEWKLVSGKMYIHEIAKITNDPEAGKFWLTYVGPAKNTKKILHSTLNPDQLLLSDDDHLIMWYKTAHI